MTKDQLIAQLRARIAEIEAELAKFKRGGRNRKPDDELTDNARRVREHRQRKKEKSCQ